MDVVGDAGEDERAAVLGDLPLEEDGLRCIAAQAGQRDDADHRSDAERRGGIAEVQADQDRAADGLVAEVLDIDGHVHCLSGHRLTAEDLDFLHKHIQQAGDLRKGRVVLGADHFPAAVVH